ncbi:unnamed protein product, partial [Tetraodon nigroviridis]
PSPGCVCVCVPQCPALLVVGDTSPAVEAVVMECNSRLNPTKTTLLKVNRHVHTFRFDPTHSLIRLCVLSQMADCGGLPQVVQPGKLAEAFKYFVQGMGY